MQTSTEAKQLPKLIHIARIQPHGALPVYLFLRKKTPHDYVWYQKEEDKEVETSVTGPNPEEAIRQAIRNWKNASFRTVICGFRYTLPERDEHGINALFYQMIASYQTPNGVYFDEDLGHNCIVSNASKEAIKLWKELENSGRL